MRLKTILIIVLLVLIAVIGSAAPSFACSTFMLKKDPAFIFGHNLDEREDIPGYVFINKRGVRKANFQPWDYLWSIKTPRIEWVSQYGSVTFNPNGRDFADGGINEAGLYIWEMSLIETKYPDDNSKPHLSVDQWIQYQLDNYQSVSEVIQNLAKVIPFSNAWHFFIADQQGNCATIEFINGKSVVHTNQSMPITVLCNSQYDQEIVTLKRYTGFGGWLDPFRKLPPGYGDNRFVQAATMIRDYVSGKTKPAVEYGFDILRQMERGGNRWQVVIDVPNSMVYFNTSLLRKIKYFSYQNFDFSTKSPVQVFDLYSNLTGDITKKFVNYTVIRNTSLRIKMMDTVLKINPNHFSLPIRIVLAILFLIFISPFVVWLFRFIKRRVSAKRERELTSTEISGQNRFQSSAARITAAFNSIFNLILIYFFVKYNYYILRDGLSSIGGIVLFGFVSIVFLTMGEIILIINIWKNKTWPLWERLYYLLLTLTAAVVLFLIGYSYYVVKW